MVRSETRQGKGHVVRRMFADVEADIYVLVDGDGTYEAADAPSMVEQLRRRAARHGGRVAPDDRTRARPSARGHRFGNDLLTGFLGLCFGRTFTDILSGYRVFSRRFVKSFPALSRGFEIETELSVHALELRMPIAEVVTAYRARPAGSASKLHTYRDGWRILMMILNLFKRERPLAFFSIIAAALALAALLLAYPIFVTYVETGLVPRFPTAILATGLMILSCLSLTSGFVLDIVTHGRREMKRLAYLSIPPIED